MVSVPAPFLFQYIERSTIIGRAQSRDSPKKNGVTVIVFLNRYPSKVEGVSDRFLAEIIKVLEPLFSK